MLDVQPDVHDTAITLLGKKSVHGGVTSEVWHSWWAEEIGERISYLEVHMEVAKEKISKALEVFSCADKLMLGNLMELSMSCVYSLFEPLIRMRLHFSSFFDSVLKVVEPRLQHDKLGSEVLARKQQFTSKCDGLLVELLPLAKDLATQASCFSDVIHIPFEEDYTNKDRQEEEIDSYTSNSANLSKVFETTLRFLEKINPENFT